MTLGQPMRRLLALVHLLAWLLWAAPCLAAPPPADDVSAGGDEHPVRVLAASSLTDVVTELGRRYESIGEQRAPVFAFSGSSQLVRQVNHGDPAEIVVTADEAWMGFLVSRGHVAPQSVYRIARNRLVVVTPAGRGDRIAKPGDLTRDDIKTIAVTAEQVPAGRRAREALAHFGLAETLAPKFVIGRNVRGTLALVNNNEVDAAVVYLTDALAAPSVDVQLTFPAESHADIVYPVGLTARGEDSPEAAAFLEFLRGPQGEAVLREAGFEPIDSQPTGKRTAPSWRRDADVSQGGTAPVWLSLWVAAVSLLVIAVPAICLGWLLARREFVGKTVLSTALMTPLVLPPVVVGFLLLELLGRNGPFAGLFDALGIQLAFTRWGAVVAAAVVGLPLLVLMSRLAIESVDRHYDEVAQTLGLSPFRAFLRVSLPMAAPGLLAGGVLAFARALGEFGATVVLATDVPGQTRTLAMAIFALYEQPGLESEAHELVWVSIFLCAVSLVAFERLSKLQKARLAGM